MKQMHTRPWGQCNTLAKPFSVFHKLASVTIFGPSFPSFSIPGSLSSGGGGCLWKKKAFSKLTSEDSNSWSLSIWFERIRPKFGWEGQQEVIRHQLFPLLFNSISKRGRCVSKQCTSTVHWAFATDHTVAVRAYTHLPYMLHVHEHEQQHCTVMYVTLAWLVGAGQSSVITKHHACR